LEDRGKFDDLVKTCGDQVGSLEVHGSSYRVIRAFRLGEGFDWVLAQRVSETKTPSTPLSQDDRLDLH
jgi:hypothetical protein